MRINNNSNSYLPAKYPKKVASEKTSFKGYFACPIKELHIQTAYEKTKFPRMNLMIQELNEKCKKYFEILVQTRGRLSKPQDLEVDADGFIIEPVETRYKYGQDNKLFTEDSMMLLRYPNSSNWEAAKSLAGKLKLKTTTVFENIAGGNCFLGKKPNGETFALVGDNALVYEEDEMTLIRTPKNLAESLNIKPENLYIIEQPEYHLDVAIRPLKYPYVLVNDMDLTKEFVKSEAQKKQIDTMNFREKCEITSGRLASPKETAKQLEKCGFKPILVPGTLGRRELNYMNAIVHQDTDGKLIYITNHSTYGKSEGIDMEKIFTDYLKEKAPDVKEIIFIDGESFVPSCFRQESGAIHCLTSERPDFEKWKTLSV